MPTLISLSLVFSSAANGQETSKRNNDSPPPPTDWKKEVAVRAAVGKEVAEAYGKKASARILGKVNLVATAKSISDDVKKGDYSSAAGSTVGAIVGPPIIIASAAGGIVLSSGNPLGSLPGGVAGVMVTERIERIVENEAQKLENFWANNIADRRTNLQKKFDEVGFDPAKFANGRGFNGYYNPAEHRKFEIAKLNELQRLQAEKDSKGGISHFPDPEVAKLLAGLEQQNDLELPTPSTGPKTIPFELGQGIKCGPISASEREQVQAELGVDIKELEEGRKSARKRLKSAKEYKNRMTAMGFVDTGPNTESMGRGAQIQLESTQRNLDQHDQAISKAVYKIRDKNGFCPAPIGSSPKQPQRAGQQSFGNQAKQSGKPKNPANQTILPNGCVRVKDNWCRCAGDIRQC